MNITEHIQTVNRNIDIQFEEMDKLRKESKTSMMLCITALALMLFCVWNNNLVSQVLSFGLVLASSIQYGRVQYGLELKEQLIKLDIFYRDTIVEETYGGVESIKL